MRRPSITALIDGLVARGLVDRRQEDSDRRRVALRLTDEGVSTLARADRAVDEYLIAIAGHLPDKDEAMALRSLELWARAMVESRGPAGGAGDRPAARAGAAADADEQDRGQARAGRPPVPPERSADSRGGGRQRPDARPARCAAPTSRWGRRAGTKPKATVDPDRSKSWIKRATPIVMAHKVQWFSALHLLVPRA